LNNTVCIGYYSGQVSNTSNRVEIGNTSMTWIGGQVTWSTYSDRRIKRDIRENVPGLEFIKRLRPVTYRLDLHKQNKMIARGDKNELSGDWPEKYEIEQMTMTGFIAQEVEQAAKEAGYDFSGVQKANDDLGMYSISYAQFVVPLVKAVQELNRKLERENRSLRQALRDQQSRIDALEARLDQLEKRMHNYHNP